MKLPMQPNFVKEEIILLELKNGGLKDIQRMVKNYYTNLSHTEELMELEAFALERDPTLSSLVLGDSVLRLLNDLNIIN